MKTLVAMVTIGKDKWTRRFSVRDAQTYAAKHGYAFAQIVEASIPPGERTPHWEKILIPKRHPGYERYLILDDDILINHRLAPELPEIPPDALGIVREPLPGANVGPVKWVGNSGVMIVHSEATDLLEQAYVMGEVTDVVPGFGEQPAINKVAWAADRIAKLDRRWNYILMADWLRTAHGQDYPWTKNLALSRLAKFTLFSWLLISIALKACGLKAPGAVMRRLDEAYFIHLIAFRMGVGLVHRFAR